VNTKSTATLISLLGAAALAMSAVSAQASQDDISLLLPFANTSTESMGAYPQGFSASRSVSFSQSPETSYTINLSDVTQDALLNVAGAGNRSSSGVDLNASYVWESSRFGHFVLSTRTTYVAQTQRQMDGVRESGNLSSLADNPAMSTVPDMQSSLMFTWQIGNHQATATTHYVADSVEDFAQFSMDQLDELVGYIAALDLSYGYNVRTGRSGNTLFSVGVRNTYDRRPPLMQINNTGTGRVLDSNGRVAYGTIKYQF
jgi:hypothetical protein